MTSRILFLLGLLLASSALFAADVVEDVRPVIRVGLVNSLTGNLAYIGEDSVIWKDTVLDAVNSPDNHYRYELYIEDNQSQPRQSVQAAQRLIADHKVNFLLSYTSAGGAAVAPVAQTHKIPHIAVAYDPRAIVGDYSLTFVNPPKELLPAFLAYIKKNNMRKIALLGVRNPTWQPIFESIERIAATGEIDLVSKTIYQPGERDFRLGIQKIPADTDLTLIASWPPEINIIARQCREQGMEVPIGSVGGSLILATDRASFDGCADIYFYNFTQAEEIHQRLTGHSLNSSSGPVLYDQFLLIVQAFESFPDAVASSDQIMQRIREIGKTEGILGKGVLGPDKAFHFSPCYYRIAGDAFEVRTADEL